MSSIDIEWFQSLDANPGGTLQRFQDYVERMELLFHLGFVNQMAQHTHL